MEEKKNLICCLCGREITHDRYAPGEYLGNNPWPLADGENDRCCDWCNDTKVIPARIELVVNPSSRS